MENSSDRLEFFLSFMENSSERLVISIPEISLHCPAPWVPGRWALGKHNFFRNSRLPLAAGCTKKTEYGRFGFTVLYRKTRRPRYGRY